MTNKVHITIEGIQAGDESPVTTTAAGSYHFTNGWHYIQYEESTANGKAVIKNMIKIKPEQVILTKKGPALTQMVFDLREKTQTEYHTPYGSIAMEIETKDISLLETAEKLEVKLHYTLLASEEPLLDNTIIIHIESEKELQCSTQI